MKILTSTKYDKNKSKHCEVFVSLSDWVLGNYIDLHVSYYLSQAP